ncbi:MAG: exosortase K [Tannerella sp.]|nr:exosortase K [Tannerella sp.]
MKNNAPYYLTAITLFLLLKFGFTFAGNDNLAFLLKPVDKLVCLITGSSSVYFPDRGYFHDQLQIVIDKSCSGFNFWLICFLMLTFLLLKQAGKPVQKGRILPLALAGAYVFTIFVNTSRIIAAVVIQNQAIHFLPAKIYLILHQSVGIVVYLTFLILIYFLIEKYLNKRQSHEKST